MGGQNPLGGSSPEGAGSQLAQLFGSNAGYQMPNQVAPLAPPQYPSPLSPSPAQAAATTAAGIQARMPMAAPASAPRRLAQPSNPYNLGRNGAASQR